ncbi:zinc finger MYM-type protein 1-like [Rhopalosiphum padi]|uniref:zinc finger MYM-type protein 1-like n=1 Tax=Rhopalosiphum padi TaxID=40932 RepID=UPI00298D9FF7|nr:zinc finger MYM-type protein 1-like [Rhopalosiphum padi]
MSGEGNKRQRLSGAQYKKKRFEREVDSARQRSSLLQFLKPNQNEFQQIEHNSSDPSKWPDPLNGGHRLILVRNNPVQIILTSYPINDDGRSFSRKYFYRRLSNGENLQRTWLIYSKTIDSVFCFCCKLFKPGTFSLASCGNRDWKDIGDILKNHENSPNHKNALLRWKELETRVKMGKTIDDVNQVIIRAETEHWKSVINRIISLIKIMAGENLPLRGDSDKLNTPHNDNFLKIIEFLGLYDPIMKEHIRRITSEEIHSHYLDCTPDISHKEQITMIFRFVTTTEGINKNEKHTNVSVNEHFIDFIELHSTTGLAMTNVLIQKLKDLEIPIDDMRGQGYDNGSNMRGQNSGVQARVREINSRAFYVPCNAHCLNLVLNDAANCCLDAVKFFSLIQEIYVFFSGSTYRWDVFKKHVSSLTLKPLSATRWESRVDAVKAIRFQVGEVNDSLIEIVEDVTLVNATGVKCRAEAQSIADKLVDYKLLCCLVIWYDVLFEINHTSKLLQSVSLNISETIAQLNNTIIFLKEYRTDEGFQKTLEKAKTLANELQIEDNFPVPTRTRHTAIQSISERFSQLTEHSNLFSFLYNITDISDFDELMKNCKDLQIALTSSDGLISDKIAVEMYSEIISLQKRFTSETCNPKSVLEYICRNKLIELYPNTYVRLRILLTIPVTAATAERSFLKLKILKNYLRSNISQDRLVGLATLSIEKEIAKELDMDELIQIFTLY